ncbi:hypothetical protein HOY80DRAFT_1110789 [Tuber brumale]|nr:hypothetical protein HOY80DRAFT_1110789 [Tuber brumale]
MAPGGSGLLDGYKWRSACDPFESEPKSPVRPSSCPDGTDGVTGEDVSDGQPSWRPSRTSPEMDGRALQVSQAADSAGHLHVMGKPYPYRWRVVLLVMDGSIFRRTDAHALQLETPTGTPRTRSSQVPTRRTGRLGTLLFDTVLTLVDNWVRRWLDQHAKKDKVKKDIEMGITTNAAAPEVSPAAPPAVPPSVHNSPVCPSFGLDMTEGSTWEDAWDGQASWRPSRPLPGTGGWALQVSRDEESARFLQGTADDGRALKMTVGPW